MPKARQTSTLAALRRRLGLSKAAMARLVGISPTHWRFLETGQRVPSLELAHRIARAGGASIEELFGHLADGGGAKD
jgi:DNA-binding XRE family transcriptional regulator